MGLLRQARAREAAAPGGSRRNSFDRFACRQGVKVRTVTRLFFVLRTEAERQDFLES